MNETLSSCERETDQHRLEEAKLLIVKKRLLMSVQYQRKSKERVWTLSRKKGKKSLFTY